MRTFITASALTLGLGIWGCSGGGYSSGSPAAPTPMASNGVVTINVVAINGAQSFSPNPATLPAGLEMPGMNVKVERVSRSA